MLTCARIYGICILIVGKGVIKLWQDSWSSPGTNDMNFDMHRFGSI